MTFQLRKAAAGGFLVLSIWAAWAQPAAAEMTVEALTSSAVSGVGPFRQDVTDAIGAFGARDYKTALEKLQNAKKSTPMLAPPEIMMAQLHFDANQPLPALAMLEQAMKNAPNDPEAYVLLIERALAEGRTTEAGLLYAKLAPVLRNFQQNPRRRDDLQRRAFNAGATIDEAQGNLDAAQAKLEALLKISPGDATANNRLGQMHFAKGEWNEALEAFRLAESDRRFPPGELVMAMLWQDKDKAEAEKWMQTAVKRHASDPRTFVGAANFMLRANRLDQAKSFAAQAVKLDPNGFDSNLIAGIVARMDGDYRMANHYLSRAQLLQPASADVMNHLALSLVELPDAVSHARALQYAQLIAKQNPTNPNILATLGWVNYRLDRANDAKRAFQAVFNSRQVRATQTMSSEMGYYLANMAKDQGNAEEAVKLLREALNTDQPFAYRKMANQMLEELSKAPGNSGTAPASTKTGN